MIPLPCRRLAAGLAFAGCTVMALAADLGLPPISGELSGHVSPLALPGAPVLQWKMNLRQPPGEPQQASLAIAGTGTLARLDAQMTAPDKGKWQLKEGAIDLSVWLPAALARWPMLAGLSVSGAVTLSGTGEFEGHAVRGGVMAILAAEQISLPADNIVAEGVALSLELNSLMPAASAEAQVLTIRTIRASGITMTDVRVVFSLTAKGEVRVAEASLAVLGGRVSVAPFAVELARPVIATTVAIEKLSLAELSPFLPKSVAAARGMLHGQLAVSWSEASGFVAKQGIMSLDVDVEASVRLAPAPGFLSSRVPARFDLLPSWTGPFQRWFSADNPAFATLRAIEMGETSLIVQSLSVQLGSAGDEEGRTATVRLVAHPPDSSVVRQVGFDINISGPLADVIGLGLKQNFSITAR